MCVGAEKVKIGPAAGLLAVRRKNLKTQLSEGCQQRLPEGRTLRERLNIGLPDGRTFRERLKIGFPEGRTFREPLKQGLPEGLTFRKAPMPKVPI